MAAKQNSLIALLREMVECESPSDDPAAVDRFGELLADRFAGLGKVRRVNGRPHGKHLLCEFSLPGRRKQGQVLALGHLDTVWPVGTLKTMPWRRANGRLYGPGVLDMKAGLGFFLFAMRALRELEIPVARRVLLQANSDEEIGSLSSRALTERNASSSAAVLVLEPGTGLEGKAKTARKGVGGYLLRVTGKAAHAGIDISAGASAIEELAFQIERLRDLTDLARGVTVNIGVVRGGSRSNVVAAEAEAHIDFRVPRLGDWTKLRRKFTSLRPRDRRCRLQLDGGLNRPPLERTPGVVRLFQLARKLAAELNVNLEESSTGGGSDGNFTGALGVPTLDGVGAVGEGAHATNESILENRVADRAALLAKLVAAL